MLFKDNKFLNNKMTTSTNNWLVLRHELSLGRKPK